MKFLGFFFKTQIYEHIFFYNLFICLYNIKGQIKKNTFNL